MAVCAQAVQQADGTWLLALDPSVKDTSTCAYVVESGADVGSSLLHMSAQDGGIISAGLISCWMIAYGVRSLIDVIKGNQNES